MTVGVVGAGITGLALCHHLVERGETVRVFEAEERAGGAIRSTEVDGVVLEHGPQRTRRTDAVDELIEAAGLADAVVEADDDLPLYVYAGGRLRRVPMSVRSFLGTGLLSWRGKLRLLAEPLTAPGSPDETAAELFRRKFGDEAYENVIGPLFGGIYGSDPARMPAGHALESVLRLESAEGSLLKPAVRRVVAGGSSSAMSFDGGLQRLPAALAERYADQVSLGRAVTAIEPADGRYQVRARGEFVVVDDVVLTVPAGAAADLLEPLDATSAGALRELTYNPLALVHLRSSADAEGLGYQVRRDADLATLGVSWNASFFDRDGLYTAFLGGMPDPHLVERDPAELGDLAREEFEAVMDADAEVLNVTRLPRAMPAWDHTWSALDRVELPDGIHLATNYTGRVGIPSRVRTAAELAGRLGV
ncbi:MAG: protoporphyrinogen oxidase [Halobacteriales archaeon]